MHVLWNLTRELQPRRQHENFGTGFKFSCWLWGWRVQASSVFPTIGGSVPANPTQTNAL